jgi:hypothetical protein
MGRIGGSVEITPTARVHAQVSDIVLRETNRVRLVFRPEIVDNVNDPAACVRGTFIYQKKAKNDKWEDAEVTSLAQLKTGDVYKLELKAGETLRLLRDLSALRRRYRAEGIPDSPIRLVRIEERLAELLTLSEGDLNELLQGNQEEAFKIVGRVLHWAATSESLRRLVSEAPDSLPDLTASLGLVSLKEAISLWEQERENSSEEFWQQALQKRAFLLDQLFHYPILIVAGKAYVGGKRIDNRHGNIADILARAKTTGGALIVEIKAPSARLLGTEYRKDVYPFSTEISGAISQVLHYKASLQQEIKALRESIDERLESDEPRCLIIAGNTASELATSAKRRSFERLRERISGVMIVGFDELFGKVAELVKWLSGGPS